MRWTLADKILALPALTILVVGCISGWPLLAAWIAGVLTSIWCVSTLIELRRVQHDIQRMIRKMEKERSRPPGSDG